MEMIRRYLSCILAITLLMSSLAGTAQELTKTEVETLVRSGSFSFIAQSANPLGGPVRHLTSEYDMRIFSDSIVTYLPYFGRAFTPSASDDGGIHFTSTDFDYKLKKRKKGWDITIKPKDHNPIQQMILNISASGYATLQVISTNRQAISFNGVVTRPQQ